MKINSDWSDEETLQLLCCKEIYYLDVAEITVLKKLTSRSRFWKLPLRSQVDSLSSSAVSTATDVAWLTSVVDGSVPSKHSELYPAAVTWAASAVASAELPFAYSTLSKNISNSQCLVWGKRSTAIALAGRKAAPFTLLEGARQRLDGRERKEELLIF